MRRRTLLAAVAGIALAGCSTADFGDGETADENATGGEADDTATETTDEEPSDDAILEAFGLDLEERGFEGLSLENDDDRISLSYDASGSTDDAVAAEIELVADGYTTTIERGLSSTGLDATAYDPDDDTELDGFLIDAEWVDAYLDGSLEWNELLIRTGETFESADTDSGED